MLHNIINFVYFHHTWYFEVSWCFFFFTLTFRHTVKLLSYDFIDGFLMNSASTASSFRAWRVQRICKETSLVPWSCTNKDSYLQMENITISTVAQASKEDKYSLLLCRFSVMLLAPYRSENLTKNVLDYPELGWVEVLTYRLWFMFPQYFL